MQARPILVDGRRRAKVRRAALGAAVVMAASAMLAACRPEATASAVPTPASLEPGSQRSELCSAANVVGVGLKAEYFADAGWGGEPMLARTDGSVDFIGLADLPEALRPNLPRSARWTGWIKAPTNGVYKFHVQPVQAKVTVSRVDVQASAADTQGVDMVAGRFYPITVEVDGIDAAHLPVRLEWTAPHGARYVIPRALLNLPTETVTKPRS